MIKVLKILFLVLLTSATLAQNTGDFRTKASGSYTATNVWQHYDGYTWRDTTGRPDSSIITVTIRSGDSINWNATPISVRNLIIESNARIYNSGGGNANYLDVYGDSILIDGILGGSSANNIGLNIQGSNTKLFGSGSSTFQRLRRQYNYIDTCRLTINMNVILEFNGAVIFNNATGFFDLKIMTGSTVIASNAGSRVSINGSSGTSGNRGGTIEVLGTLIVGDILVLQTNSTIMSTPRPSKFIIGNGGVVRTKRIWANNNSSNSSNGFYFTIETNGLLSISGNHDSIRGFSYFTYAPGSIIEYTGNNNQQIAVPDTFSTLRLGGTGTKTFIGNAVINDTLEFQHAAAASVGSNSIRYLNNATLAYRDTLSSRTTAEGLPAVNGPTDLIISNAKGVTLHQSDTFRNITCQRASYLRIDTNTLGFSGNVIDTLYLGGSPSANLYPYGSGNQVLLRMSQSGTENRLNNLSFNRSNGVKLLNRLEVVGTVTHTDGTLDAGGRLFLKYVSASKYGQIAGTGSGTITGDVTMETQIDGSAGWRQLGSPFDAIVNQLNDNVTLSFSGASANIYEFDESGGVPHWKPASSKTATLHHDNAYAIYFQTLSSPYRPIAFPVTVDVRGAYRGTGNVSHSNLTYTTGSHTNSDTSGWHLIPNPFPSGLRWEPNDQSNIQGDAYNVWLHGDDAFDGWDGTASLLGKVSALVPPFSVMYINVDTNGNGQVNLNNNRRITTSKDNYYLKKTTAQNLVALMVTGNGRKDGAVFYCDYRASVGPDQRDVRKFMNNVSGINLYFPLAPNFKAAFSKVPILNGTKFSSDLRFRAGSSGIYKIWARELENIDEDLLVFLEDAAGDICVPLPGDPYQFNYNASEGEKLFRLHFIPKSDLVNQTPQEFLGISSNVNKFLVTAQQRIIEVRGDSQEPYTVQVFNLNGLPVTPETWVLSGSEPWQYMVTGNEGLYIVRVNDGLKIHSAKVFIRNQ